MLMPSAAPGAAPSPSVEPDQNTISAEIQKQIDMIMSKIEGVFNSLDEVDILNALNRDSATRPPVVTPQLKEYLKSTVDEKSELDNFIRSKYGEGPVASSPEFKVMAAAKMAYVANASLQSLMSAERAGSNPSIEGHLQRLLAMQGISDGLSGDIMFGLQDFPKEIKERLRLEHQGKNPEGEEEYNAYCDFLGVENKGASLQQAMQIQKLPVDTKKAKMAEVYKDNQPFIDNKTKAKSGSGSGR